MAGDDRGAEREADRALLGAGATGGFVAFVEIPADPDLLTLKDLRLLQDADAVFHPAGMDVRVLEFARRDAERVAGGSSGDAAARVKAGQRVVRLGEALQRPICSAGT